MAENDSIKRNFLEIKLKKEGLSERTTISFMEYEGKIISCEILVPKTYIDLFQRNFDDTNYETVKGVWVPTSYAISKH